jgi:hypothetical protein
VQDLVPAGVRRSVDNSYSRPNYPLSERET